MRTEVPLTSEGRAEAMRRLLESSRVSEVLQKKTDQELADLLLNHVWAYLEAESPQSDLVAECYERLKGRT